MIDIYYKNILIDLIECQILDIVYNDEYTITDMMVLIERIGLVNDNFKKYLENIDPIVPFAYEEEDLEIGKQIAIEFYKTIKKEAEEITIKTIKQMEERKGIEVKKETNSITLKAGEEFGTVYTLSKYRHPEDVEDKIKDYFVKGLEAVYFKISEEIRNKTKKEND